MDAEVDGILVAAMELKEPLVDLRQLALSFDGAGDADELVREKMVSVSDRAIRQINDLIKLRKLESGLFEMEPVGVRAVCDEVTSELVHLFKCNRRELFIKYASRTGLVMANRELLKSVIWNFLSNAVHYSDEGMGAELLVKDYRDKVRVMIRDYGPALPMDVWKELRRGFVEKPISIAMRPGSSGLGLYIASRFSSYMNAEVGAVRHRDGTSFYVELTRSMQARLF